MDKKRNSVEFEVYGKYALFSEVATRVGGEKFSYQVPTYQALKGILESVYWKPTFIWVIDAVRVMNKIQTEGKGIRPIKMNGGNDLAYYTYLKDVRYQVLAHFEWNEQREDLKQDRNENKHHNIAKRCIENGGRRDIFLGTRECQGYARPCSFNEEIGFYDNYGDLDMGYMFYGFDYPDENTEHNFVAKFWRPIMKNGIIEFAMPSANCLDKHIIRENLSIKHFEVGRNFSLCEEV
jgi:CRISPR-associated protein Cas5d